MSLIRIVQRVSTYNFVQPEYKQIMDDAIDLLNYLKENPSSENEGNHRAMKAMFWDVIMRIANYNSFQGKNKDN